MKRPDPSLGRAEKGEFGTAYRNRGEPPVESDLGDPLGAARRVRKALKPDGTWMIVEPRAGDRLEENLNPIGRLFYGASTLICTPHALSEGGETPLGAQAGEARIQGIVEAAGFRHFRRATETPINMVLEARP